MVAQLRYWHRIATCIEELDSVGVDMDAGVNGAERVEVGEHIDQCLSQNLELRAVFHIESLVVHHEWSIHDEAQSPNHNLKILPKVLLLGNAVGIAGSGFSYTSTWNLHQVHPKRRNITANPFFFAKAHQTTIIQMSLIVGNSDALAEVGDVIAYQIRTRTIELEVVAIVTNGILIEHGEV